MVARRARVRVAASVGAASLYASALWTLQHLCFGPDVAADYSDRGENRDPGRRQEKSLTKETRLENALGWQGVLCAFVQDGQVQSYVRPLCAAPMAAGPDDIRGVIPFTSTSLML